MRILKVFPMPRPAENPRLLRPPRPGLQGRALAAVSFPVFSMRAFSWAALATALAGCDGSSSVVHSAKLEAKPDMKCMQQALEHLPGVSQVAYLHEAQGTQEFDEISYHAEDQRVMLMVQPGGVYSQTFLRMGGGDDTTPRIRRVMARVDAALEKACHIRNLSRKVRETCGDAAHPEGKCPPLAP